ncbi:formate dehydrogenase accessory sulfurtransferase FdhD [Intestinibacter sp.]|uniref:formate dehydrogenase accessory sulfurtransferase FdhD n=1 Tax=Intestinibacter sp. TaxID=1965304 RepID=UPI002A7524C3|nr:formate dehydrogenase accessory sulfurtransferase FdhD [Intestinibacter sp.]MDY2734682.1 formate dehydrogenase accessory sulfurtransferase FdhD [Intestinibacter sp.]MDY4576151.1 formate dehydrogenase accessory sulfurtransferase FdhD [Intestinibacter sp.]
MENKYAKDIKQDKNKEERLVDYDYKTNFRFEVVKVKEKDHKEELETVIGEFPLALVLNGDYSNTFLCTPENLDQLVAGFLMTKGIIKCKFDIKSIEVDFENRVANAVVEKNKAFDRGKRFYLNDLDYVDLKPIENTDATIKVNDIYLVMKENLTSSELFKNTGGVHSVAIYDNQNLITIKEDVARHNAMDKAIGYCVLNNIDLKDKIIFVSGRISCEMILKAAKSGIPIVISKSAPTNLSVEIAKKLNITLAGFVRGERMNIYTNPQRIIFE